MNTTTNSGSGGNSSIKYLGNVTNMPTNIRAQINQVNQQILQDQEKVIKYGKRYQTLSDYNKTLSESYLSNLKVFVEVAKLLGDYKQLLDSIIILMKNWKNNIDADIDPNEIEYLKKMTVANLLDLDKVFNKELTNVKTIFTDIGQVGIVRELDNANQNYNAAKNRANVTYNAFVHDIRHGAKHSGNSSSGEHIDYTQSPSIAFNNPMMTSASSPLTSQKGGSIVMIRRPRRGSGSSTVTPTPPKKTKPAAKQTKATAVKIKATKNGSSVY